jgi:hypothetical protein
MLEIETSTRPLSATSIRRRFLLLTAGLSIFAPGFTVAGNFPDAAVPIQGPRLFNAASPPEPSLICNSV